jgi:hypothetical protein
MKARFSRELKYARALSLRFTRRARDNYKDVDRSWTRAPKVCASCEFDTDGKNDWVSS